MKVLFKRKIFWRILKLSITCLIVVFMYQYFLHNKQWRLFNYVKPITKIGYLKTHKCASTTIQNMLLRYAYHHDLNVVIPEKANYLGQGHPFTREKHLGKGFPWGDANTEYDIFCMHTFWNHEEVKAALGGKVFFFTMLRDPLELFISLWNYYGLANAYQMTLEEYALKDDKMDRKHWYHIGGNQMLFDFGVEMKFIRNESAVVNKIKEIEANFDLVLIQEKFLESIILLKDALHWTFEEMSFVQLNSRGNKKQSADLSPEALNSLKKWLWPDYMLYNHFHAKFNHITEQFGAERMSSKLEEYQQLNVKCESPIESRLCFLHHMKELPFIDLLRVEQSRRLSLT